MHLLDAIIDPYQKLKAKRAAWHSTPIFNIQFSSYHPIPYHFYPVGIRLHLRSSTTSRQPRLGLLCSRHLQPSLRPCAEAFDGPTDLRRSGRGTVQEVPQQTQLLGVAVETLSGAERHTWKVGLILQFWRTFRDFEWEKWCW